MLSLTVLLLVAVSGVFSASSVPRCPPDILDRVSAQWRITGRPRGVTSFKDSFKVIAGTKSPISDQAKCKTFRFTPGNLYDVSDNQFLPCSENNGVLTFPDSFSYVVTLDKAVLTTVRCSKDGPTPTKDNPIVLSLGATSKATPNDIMRHFGILGKFGMMRYYKC